MCCFAAILLIPIRESFFVQSIPTTYAVTIRNVVRKSNSKVDTCQIFRNDTKPVQTTQKPIGLLKNVGRNGQNIPLIFFLPKLCTKMNSSISGFYTQKWRNLRCSQHQQFRNAQYYTHTRFVCRAAHICVCLVLWNVIKV